MGSNADRQKRYRRHKANDHSLCLVGSCEVAASAAVEPVTPADDPVTAVTRGALLWVAMGGDGLPPAARVLLEEACRIADRLDALDRLLAGTAADWISLVEDKGDPERQLIVIDRPLAEARQQATALKQLVAEIRAMGVVKTGPAKVAPTGEVAGVTNLATWAPARSAKASG